MVKNLVQQLREQRGVSKSHLARKIAVSPSYINLLETQQRMPSVQVLCRIASYFKCRLDEVLEYRPERGQK